MAGVFPNGRWPWRRWRAVDLQIAAGLLACICALTLDWGIATRIDRDRERQAVARAYENLRRNTSQLAVEWEARLTLVEALHNQGRAVLRAPADSALRQEALADLRATVARSGSGIEVVSAVGRDGAVIWSSSPAATAARLQDRDYFKAIFRQGLSRVIGNPVIGFATGHVDIPFAEAAPGPDGNIDALTVVSLPASVIHGTTRYFEGQGISVIALVREDGVVLAREPTPEPGAQIPQPDALFRSASGRMILILRHRICWSSSAT